MRMQNNKKRWPAVTYEMYPWNINSAYYDLISRTQRQKIRSTYQAALPARIKDLAIPIDETLVQDLVDTSVRVGRFDEIHRQKPYNLPALILRSESSASSQIEHLTSNARNVALADLNAKGTHNATLISANIRAMRRALNHSEPIDTQLILEIHKSLLENANEQEAGKLRDTQVWLGGSNYSPHGALFVPPVADEVASYMQDLVEFIKRDDINPVIKAALAHAQFETIHPFSDGNGRTGRALIHLMLKRDGVLRHTTLPLSAGLLHNKTQYMQAIREYQEGNPLLIIDAVIHALDAALLIGQHLLDDIENLLATWGARMHERSDSYMQRLMFLLVEQSVITSAYVARSLKITQRASRNLIHKAEQYKILSPLGAKQRGDYYQAKDVLFLLDEIGSSTTLIRTP